MSADTVFQGAGVNHCTSSAGSVQAAHTLSGATGSVRSMTRSSSGSGM